jgi:hypothetical protein
LRTIAGEQVGWRINLGLVGAGRAGGELHHVILGQQDCSVGQKNGARVIGSRNCIWSHLDPKAREDDAENIVRAVVSAAKAGDPTAMRLCIERLVPVRNGRPIIFDLPDIETAPDISKALGVIAKSMAAGELTPDEAGTVATVIEAHRKAIETAEFEERLRKLEARLDQ